MRLEEYRSYLQVLDETGHRLGHFVNNWEDRTYTFIKTITRELTSAEQLPINEHLTKMNLLYSTGPTGNPTNDTFRARIIVLQDMVHQLSQDMHYARQNNARDHVDGVYYKLGEAKDSLTEVVL